MTEHAAAYKELRRSKTDRMVGGVCGGLGRYFDVNPAFYRVGFVILALLGGAGILIYLAALLVLPNDDETDSVATEILRDHRQRPVALVALAVLAVVGFAILSRATLWPHGDAAWILLIVAGTIIFWSQRRARGERPRVLRAVLIVLGALIALMLVSAAIVASVFSVHLRNGIGDRVYHPASYAGVEHKYRLGIGSMKLDLGNVRFPKGETHVDARIGIGDLRIVVPDDVTVHAIGDAEVGKVSVFDQTDDGHNPVVSTTNTVGTGDHVLDLDAHVGAGRVVVTHAGA
jgi:phage shock protein PspC (stress-responsive transcriptional regulator)